jgi:hypothetical protein
MLQRMVRIRGMLVTRAHAGVVALRHDVGHAVVDGDPDLDVRI